MATFLFIYVRGIMVTILILAPSSSIIVVWAVKSYHAEYLDLLPYQMLFNLKFTANP